MTIQPTDFEAKYGLNLERLGKEIDRRRKRAVIIAILMFFLKVTVLFGIIFFAIYIYNFIF